MKVYPSLEPVIISSVPEPLMEPSLACAVVKDDPWEYNFQVPLLTILSAIIPAGCVVRVAPSSI